MTSHYPGGKRKYASAIAEAMLDNSEGQRSVYWEPFCGSCAVALEMAPYFDRVVLSDVNEDLIILLRAFRDGWMPDTKRITRAEASEWSKAPQSAQRSWVGFTYYIGFFDFYRGDDHQPSERAAKNWSEAAKVLVNAELISQDYRKITPTFGDVVYLDPPYNGTKPYRGAPKFDSLEFFRRVLDWARGCNPIGSKGEYLQEQAERGVGASVFFSEVDAPPPFKLIWETSMSSSVNVVGAWGGRPERLFTYCA